MSVSDREKQLRNRMAELEARIGEIDAALEAPHSKDWEDQAVEREGEEVLEDLGHSGQAEIAQIRAALDRIAEGEYGYCVKCGNEIARERLDILPATPFCAACAQ